MNHTFLCMRARRGSSLGWLLTDAWTVLTRAGMAEVQRVVAVVRQRWRDRKVLGFGVTLLLCAGLLIGRLLDAHRAGEVWIDDCCAEQASYPVLRWLWRMPGSVLAPAHDLPVWGSIIQVLVVVGIAEAAVGVRRTVFVAAAGHFVATLGARALVVLGPATVFGLPAVDGRLPDTGPSAVTVALTAYLTIVLRCPILGSLAGAGIAVATLTHSDLAGREHVLAWLVGMGSGALQFFVFRQRATRMADGLDERSLFVRP